MDKWLKRKISHEDLDQDPGPSTSPNVRRLDCNYQSQCKNKNPEKETQGVNKEESMTNHT